MDDVYENISTSSNGGNEARMSEINRIRNKLEKAVTCRKKSIPTINDCITQVTISQLVQVAFQQH